METEYFKICHLCNNKVFYKNRNSYYANRNLKQPCWNCKNKEQSQKTKGIKHGPFTEEHKRNLVVAHKDSKIWKDSMNTPEYKRIHRENKLGDKNYMFGKHLSEDSKDNLSKKAKIRLSSIEEREKISISTKNAMNSPEVKKKLSDFNNRPETKKLRREKRLQQLKLSGRFPAYNEISCKFFNLLNENMHWNGQHALSGGEKEMSGYSVDYYVPELNLVIEWDEDCHYRGKGGTLLKKDINRQNNIISDFPHIQFLRIREKTKEVFPISSNIPIEIITPIRSTLNKF